jgi:hypothetical protein
LPIPVRADGATVPIYEVSRQSGIPYITFADLSSIVTVADAVPISGVFSRNSSGEGHRLSEACRIEGRRSQWFSMLAAARLFVSMLKLLANHGQEKTSASNDRE